MNDEKARRMGAMTFRAIRLVTAASNGLKLPVVSTGRPFSFYCRVFFGGRTESDVLDSFQGQTIVDIGCGLTPYTADSMFQACHKAGIDFYGVDPKLDQAFDFGRFDQLKVAVTGGHRVDPNAPGKAHRLAVYADDLPMASGTVDLMLSSWALFVWIADPDVLGRVLAEAARVLRPGGELKIYPTPHREELLRALGAYDPTTAFDIRQVFLAQVSVLNLPPAFRTTFVRRVDPMTPG